MSVKSRVKKLEKRSNVGFVVAVLELDYHGDDCTGATARLKNQIEHKSQRKQDEELEVFKKRFARESKEVCRERLSGKAKTVVVLDEKVRLL